LSVPAQSDVLTQVLLTPGGRGCVRLLAALVIEAATTAAAAASAATVVEGEFEAIEPDEAGDR
jgi:hypothetical protein